MDTASIPAPGDQVAVRTHDDGARGMRGVVARIDEQTVTLRLDGERPNSPAPVLIVPIGEGPAFTPISCVIDDQAPGEEGVSVFRIRRREAFRVRPPAGACTAELPDGSRTAVLNISGDGIAIQVEHPPEIGTRIACTLSDATGSVSGAFIVRNRRPIGAGTIIGLQVAGDADALRCWMHDRVIMHMCAKLAAENDFPGVSSACADGPPPAAVAPGRAEGALPPESCPHHGADLRPHPCRAFRSMGMAYVMESNDNRRTPIETIDISRSGVAMRASFALEKGRRVMVVMDRRTGAPWVLGKVVHCAPAGDPDGGFRVGVRFIQSALQDWPAPEPASLLRVAADLERAEPRRGPRKKRPGLSISFG